MSKLAMILVILSPWTSAWAQKNCDDAKNFGEVSLTEVAKAVETKTATFLDANSKSSFEKTHIPGAVHFKTAKKEKNLANRLPAQKDALLIAYCGGPMCTAWEDAATAACELGYTNVKHYKGGLKGWKEHSKTTKI